MPSVIHIRVSHPLIPRRRLRHHKALGLVRAPRYPQRDCGSRAHTRCPVPSRPPSYTSPRSTRYVVAKNRQSLLKQTDQKRGQDVKVGGGLPLGRGTRHEVTVSVPSPGSAPYMRGCMTTHHRRDTRLAFNPPRALLRQVVDAPYRVGDLEPLAHKAVTNHALLQIDFQLGQLPDDPRGIRDRGKPISPVLFTEASKAATAFSGERLSPFGFAIMPSTNSLSEEDPGRADTDTGCNGHEEALGEHGGVLLLL